MVDLLARDDITEIAEPEGARSWEDAMARSIATELALRFWYGHAEKPELLAEIPSAARSRVERFGSDDDGDDVVHELIERTRVLLSR